MNNSKVLKARFVIPKDKIKNANVQLNPIVSSIKSSWIREYSEKIWSTAAAEQFNIIAKEPDPSSIVLKELPEDIKDIQVRLNELKNEFDVATIELKEHQANDKDYKGLKKERTAAKRAEDIEKLEILEAKINEYETRLDVLKATKARRQKTLSRFKSSNDKEVKKVLRKVEETNKRNYIKAKVDANKYQHLFKTCFIAVTVHNITNRDFDSPNFYPTLKPILDAGTDTGILWEDDNNRIIRSTTFLPGTNLDRNNYILDVEIYESIEDFYEKLKESNSD